MTQNTVYTKLLVAFVFVTFRSGLTFAKHKVSLVFCFVDSSLDSLLIVPLQDYVGWLSRVLARMRPLFFFI